MAMGYFCISAVSTYDNSGEYNNNPDYADLDLVPREAATMREAFTGLGLVELFSAPDGELTHDELHRQLSKRRTVSGSAGPDEEPMTLVLYCTGHGAEDPDAGWLLVPPAPGDSPARSWITPAHMLQAVQERRDVSQVVLILDACYSGAGAGEALAKALDSAIKRGSDTDLWVVAAARRLDQAQQMTFVPAFVRALHRQAEYDVAAPYLDPSTVTDLAAAALEGKQAEQAPWVAAGHRAGGCRVLPNPRFMPLEPPGPTWIPSQWNALARGVTRASDAGWYFTGRDDVLRVLATHTQGEAPLGDGPVLLTGSAGTGKSAVLGRLLSTATVQLRRALPPVARGGYLPIGDVPCTALDVDGLDVPATVEELAGVFGVPAGDTAGLISALAERDRRLALLVDNLDRAVDPIAMVEQLLRPLAAVPPVRIAATARTAIPGMHRIDLHGPDDDSDAAIDAYVRARLAYAPATRRGTDLTLLATAATTLVRASAANFAAAVSAVDSLLYDLAAEHAMRDATDRAVRAAHRRLDVLCRDTMRSCAARPAEVDDLVACLSAACSYSPDGRLPAELWAAVAGGLTGQPYPTGNVAACAAAATAFLDVRSGEEGTSRWRPRFGYVGRANDPYPHRVAEILIDEARRIYGPHWTGCPADVFAVMLGAAGHPDGRFAALLDEAQFLLAAPGPLVARAVRNVRGRAGGPARMATWAGVPVHGEARERAFLLRLRAARNGLAPLASSAPDRGPHASLPVAWASRVTSPERPSMLTRLAVAGDADDWLLVTAHDDASVRWWDGGSGQHRRAWPQRGTRWTDAAVLSIAAAVTARGPVTAVATGDHRAHLWRPEDATSPRPLPEPATLVAAHAAGLVALVHGPAVTVRDVTHGSDGPSHTLPDEVLCAAFAGEAGDPVLWLVDAGGRVWRWDLHGGTRRPSAVSLCSAPLMLAGSPRDAAAVVVDVRGRLTLPTYDRGAVRLEPSVPRSVAVSADWLVLGGGSDRTSGWLEIHRADGTVPATRWPFDGTPIGLGVVGDVAAVATPDGLAAVRLSRAALTSPGGHDRREGARR
jgi:hypothetical protein